MGESEVNLRLFGTSFGCFLRVFGGAFNFLLGFLLQFHIFLVELQNAGLANPFIPVLAPPRIVDVVFNSTILDLSL